METKPAMKHPNIYTTIPYNGFHFIVVDAGTVISDDHTGTEETVDDVSIVLKGRVIWCTQHIFDKIKTQVKRNVH